MAKRTASEIYADFRGAGFDAAQATVMTAIALAESGGDDAALGDVGLQTDTWGPSYGLAQVRTLKAETGHGTIRDIAWLTGSDAHQAQAAYQISDAGHDFSPWSVYTSGKYRDYLGQAQAAAGVAATPAGDKTGPFPTWGPSWLPWNWGSDAANAATGAALSGARSIVVEGVFVGLGLALVGVGLARAMAPRAKRKMQRDVRRAKTAAEIGAML